MITACIKSPARYTLSLSGKKRTHQKGGGFSGRGTVRESRRLRNGFSEMVLHERHTVVTTAARPKKAARPQEEVGSMLDRIALILLIIGGLNWGSIGIFQFDIVAWICGGQTGIISRIIYTLVALSAIWCISLLFRDRIDIEERQQLTT